MNEEPQIPIQAVIEELMERIGSLELEIAVLKARLSQIKPVLPLIEAEKEPQDDSGSYL